jgi:hypothetical protein
MKFQTEVKKWNGQPNKFGDHNFQKTKQGGMSSKNEYFWAFHFAISIF